MRKVILSITIDLSHIIKCLKHKKGLYTDFYILQTQNSYSYFETIQGHESDSFSVVIPIFNQNATV